MDKFLSLLHSRDAELVYHGRTGETVILREKQPHEVSERLFECLTPADKVKVEASLYASSDGVFTLMGGKYICAVGTVSGHSIAAIDKNRDAFPDCYGNVYDAISRLNGAEFDTGDPGGICFAKDVFERIIPDLLRCYPDMEFEFSSNRERVMLFVSLANIIRICMLCAETANRVSTDRRLLINIYSISEIMNIEFSCSAPRCEFARDCLELAGFIAEREKGQLSVENKDGRLRMSFYFLAQPEELPEFKFRDQFARYGEYWEKAAKELASLRTQQQGEH